MEEAFYVLGSIAHPANLTDEEVRAIAGPVGGAAGGVSASFSLMGFFLGGVSGADECRAR